MTEPAVKAQKMIGRVELPDHRVGALFRVHREMTEAVLASNLDHGMALLPATIAALCHELLQARLELKRADVAARARENARDADVASLVEPAPVRRSR